MNVCVCGWKSFNHRVKQVANQGWKSNEIMGLIIYSSSSLRSSPSKGIRLSKLMGHMISYWGGKNDNCQPGQRKAKKQRKVGRKEFLNKDWWRNPLSSLKHPMREKKLTFFLYKPRDGFSIIHMMLILKNVHYIWNPPEGWKPIDMFGWDIMRRNLKRPQLITLAWKVF